MGSSFYMPFAAQPVEKGLVVMTRDPLVQQYQVRTLSA